MCGKPPLDASGMSEAGIDLTNNLRVITIKLRLV